VIPKGFTRGYLSGRAPVALELVKNPARAIHPAVVEETLGLLASALNAVAHTLGDDLAAWGELLESRERFDFDAAARLLRATGDRLAPARAWLDPPLVTYESETKPGEEKKGPAWSLFAFLLIGMAAMFLLYIADNAMRDLYRELRFHTIDRFRTLHEGLFAFVAGKAAFAIVAVLVGAVILFGGGALVFAFAWRRPLPLVILVLAYAVFAAGFLGALAALGGSERRAEVLDNVIVMGVSLAGGCMFPPEQLPAFLREHVTPLLPTAWFTAAARALQDDPAYGGWTGTAAALVGAGVVLLAVAALLLQRRLSKGARA
jgi:ABC-type multidrug transport system permease subunit